VRRPERHLPPIANDTNVSALSRQLMPHHHQQHQPAAAAAAAANVDQPHYLTPAPPSHSTNNHTRTGLHCRLSITV